MSERKVDAPANDDCAVNYEAAEQRMHQLGKDFLNRDRAGEQHMPYGRPFGRSDLPAEKKSVDTISKPNDSKEERSPWRLKNATDVSSVWTFRTDRTIM